MALADFDGAEEIRRSWLAGMAPDPAQTVSAWADRHRMLSSRGASEAGPYRTSRTPYMREIMDSLSPMNPARRVVFMKAAQVGATEAGNNWLGYCIHRAPGPFLLVQPTTDMAKRLSQQRVEPLIEESPALRELVAPSRTRDSGNTVMSKRFPGGILLLTGANSAVGLRSMPARWVFLDEVDGYPGDVDGEGSPIRLAEQRTNSFGHRAKIFLASTPTIKGWSRIEREWELSDQRRYHVPCPFCGGLQWLKFERLKWQWGRPETVRYICEHCEEPINERHKSWMLDEANGACWIPTAPDDVRERAERDGTVGFHISGLYSPLGWMSWVMIAQQKEAAFGNEQEEKTFKMTVQGETWQERGEAPDWQRIYERREPGQLSEVPRGALLLTAGADVQRDRIEVDVWGWGRDVRSWLVDHIVLEGDTARAEVWDELTALLGETWPHASGARMALARLAIDSGDGMTTDAVYTWVRKNADEQVLAVKGDGGGAAMAPVDGPSHVDVTERGRKIRRGVALWKVRVGYFKSETYRYLRLERPTEEELRDGAEWPAGYIHIPQGGVTAEWIKQLTAEQLITTRTRLGAAKREWQQLRDRNEALDCRVYARAAAWLMGIDRWEDRRWVNLETQLQPARNEKRTEPPVAGRPVGPARRRPRVFRSSYMD